MTTIQAKGISLRISVMRPFTVEQLKDGVKFYDTETVRCEGKSSCWHEPRLKFWRGKMTKAYHRWRYKRPAHNYEREIPLFDTVEVVRPQKTVEINGETITIEWL